MEYLEEKYPEVSLMPKDLAGRAKVWCMVHKSPGQRPKEVDLAFYVLLDSRVPFFFT